MNKDFALHAIEAFSDNNFLEYIDAKNIINDILEKFINKHNNNKLVNKQTTYLFAYTKDRKQIILVRFEQLKKNLKISLLLEDKDKISSFGKKKKSH